MKESGLSKFVAATMAFLTGDTDTALALKNERLAKAAIKGQLSALEGELVNNEVAVEAAVEAFDKAVCPSKLISSQEGYVNGVLDAKESLDSAEATLAATKKTIAFLNSLLKDKF